jgi:valyl-tRNA synthetase
MLGIHLTGVAPFHTVYLSGIVRDPLGQKMSKTKGNVVDPLETIDEFGADALRFALVHGTAPGNDLRLSRVKLENARNFANKLWNAARFVLGARPATIPSGAPRVPPEPAALGPADRWLRSRVAATVGDVDRTVAEYAFGEMCRVLYEGIWNDYCDWGLELAKVRLADATLGPAEREATWWTLVEALDTYLRLLHPVMPFVTEVLWDHLPKFDDEAPLLIGAAWPAAGAVDPTAEAEVAPFLDLVRAVRNARAEARLEPAAWLPVEVAVPGHLRLVFDELRPALARLARARPLALVEEGAVLPGAAAADALVVLAGDLEALVRPAGGGGHADRDRARLGKELADTQSQLAAVRARLADESFTTRAPGAVVDGARARQAELADRVARLQARLAE